MILHKGKQNFWSQLLISMIAIFALPQVQGNQPVQTNANYQTQSAYQIQRQALLASASSVQKTIVRQIRLSESKLIPAAQNKTETNFNGHQIRFHTPIRAGPFITML
ncbi:uncharacterized protein DUF2547 [Mesocricetibacter intestinalis]|uniref:Uncharacterized protein DUF2547 n=1 Tax=Mesocricetibacter intestinalis TaxID=1521930 RepID=A0A4R6VCV2_9PAST|nr:secA translation cis-regulator SecM [Mesocricetibacter intestinalis]TDQ58123.1 uncharacterized protein DUF2547 [Mesocricetibacter intestinalis]